MDLFEHIEDVANFSKSEQDDFEDALVALHNIPDEDTNGIANAITFLAKALAGSNNKNVKKSIDAKWPTVGGEFLAANLIQAGVEVES